MDEWAWLKWFLVWWMAYNVGRVVWKTIQEKREEQQQLRRLQSEAEALVAGQRAHVQELHDRLSTCSPRDTEERHAMWREYRDAWVKWRNMERKLESVREGNTALHTGNWTPPAETEEEWAYAAPGALNATYAEPWDPPVPPKATQPGPANRADPELRNRTIR